MRKQLFLGAATVAGVAILASQFSGLDTVHASPDDYHHAPAAPVVFQAAGPTVASIQSTVDGFRAALGANNGNVAGPLAEGRREINWDGGGSTATSPAPTPFDGFLVNRGARFTTPGSGFVQAPLDGIAATFANASYELIFQAFSPTRLFSAVDSRVTRVRFFVPGGGELPATSAGFGAVFSDVDSSRSTEQSRRDPSPTTMGFYDVKGKLLYIADVPASKGDGSVSFLGVVFDRAAVASVRIVAGSAAPGPNDSRTRDIVMMDDFIYGEPQAVDGGYHDYTVSDETDAR